MSYFKLILAALFFACSLSNTLYAADGDIRAAGRFVSDVATGQSPLVVNSTTEVSNLNADMLDGMHASQVIEEAQDEVRTPINSLPYTISSSGSYYIAANLDGSSGGIDVDVDNVTIDLMGFTLDGGGSVDDHGIDLIDRSNVTIMSGTIRRFGGAGIYSGSGSGYYIKVLEMQVLENGILGSSSSSSGIYLDGSNNHIIRCIVSNNGGYGIYARGAVIDQNIVHNNGGYYGIFGSTITGNRITSHQGTMAISGQYGGTITGNTAIDSQGIYAIYGSNGATIIGNTTYSNQGWGIYARTASTVKDNTLYYNNVSDTSGQGGLGVGGDSRVVGNTLSANLQNNIVVSSSDTILKENHVTDSPSGNGILFTSSGNYYLENTAAGNGTAFNLGATSQTNGGGNVAF